MTCLFSAPFFQILEEEGVYGDIAFAEVELGFVPAERDLMLLEAGDLLRDAVVEGDSGELLHVARALLRFQQHCGTIPFVKGKGTMARGLADLLLRLRKEKGPAPPGASAARGQVDCLIVLDRSVDLVTPLCTQLTYEGLCDEILRIVNGAVELPSDADPTAVKKVRLNSSDALFQQLRDLDFGRTCTLLREKSSALQQDYRNIKGGRAEEQGVSEIKGFVRALRDNMQGVGVDLHATVAKLLLDRSRSREFMQRLARCARLSAAQPAVAIAAASPQLLRSHAGQSPTCFPFAIPPCLHAVVAGTACSSDRTQSNST